MRISFDFDGVLCLTPFGRMAVHAPHVHVDDLPEAYESFYAAPARRSRLRLAVEYARFGWRRMAPDAARVLQALSDEGHDLLIVTGRSAQGESLLRRWLRRHGLEERVAEVRMAPAGLRPAQHKLAVAKMLAVDAHIDDDPRTAFYMARNGLRWVFLLDHASAVGDVSLPNNVRAVSTLADIPPEITAVAREASGR
jgi:phosphoglycolate phosphatase-like HAD superfamily hydrolase